MFEPLPAKPDPDPLERGVLEFWETHQIFDQLRAKNAEGPRFSFIDGPVTANKSLAVHTAWGRTLKDVFQRYKALQGFHQRYQNGFDCQGLWIEVGVERQLGLNSKQDIEQFGLEEFAERCRAVVESSAHQLTKGSVRLGQWMDWGRDYFTFSDTNIEYIWKFLQRVHERGWLYRGHRVTEWCPRCGTSISAHELIGSYVERTDPSIQVRLPFVDHPGEALVIWTTTPWTLPANVAAAVSPQAEYGRLSNGDWVALARAGDREVHEVVEGRDLVGRRYQGPFDDLGPGAGVDHRVIPWDDVALDEGTGVVHIAPGCGTDDFELGVENGLAVLSPVDESGRFLADYGWLAGFTSSEATESIIDDLRGRSLLVEAGTIEHRYPSCWRCSTPLIFRISDDWFISVEDVREPLRQANATVTWTPAYMGKRMDDWLVNMSDWNISRRRYYGLPLPFYPCSCGKLTVIGSRSELAERATTDLDGLQQLRRPWIDRVAITCPGCSGPVERILEVGDVWLDAGIVPFSTLGWESSTWVENGWATGAAEGLTSADLPDHGYWEEWFPADWVSEMREQIRLWFYAQLFMSVVLTGRAPYRQVLGYEKMLDEDGREMHGSWGNMIEADEAFTRMGADVMRWQFCMQPPNQNLLFGFGPGQDVRRKLLTLWNCASFLVQYANTTQFAPAYSDLLACGSEDVREDREEEVPSLDRWLVARTARLVDDATDAYESFLPVNVLRAVEAYVDDLSNWYIRRSRRRFWNGDEAALRVLWRSVVQALRVVAPILPFLSEHLWQVLVADVCDEAPPSIFLAGWPSASAFDGELLADVATVRTVVDLGRRARSSAGCRLRQPLRQMIVEGADRIGPYVDQLSDELRIDEVRVEQIQATDLRVRPNLPVLGPRLGAELGAVRRALDAGDFVERADGSIDVAGHRLDPCDVLVERLEKPGWAIASEGGISVALDTVLDDDLRRRGRVYDLIHRVNTMRKESGLDISDRIHLQVRRSEADLLDERAWIAAETLATTVELSNDDELHLSRA